MDDNIIVDLFFARNENAIKETALKYGVKLTALSYHITGNNRDTEECVNDTYLAVWKAIPPARPNYYYAFLCKIVRNISYDIVDKNTAKKRPSNLLQLTDEFLDVFSNDTQYEAEDSIFGELLDKFIRALDTKTQMIFLRRYFYEDTLSELSLLTGMSENGLAARLFRTRKKLRRYLEKEGFRI